MREKSLESVRKERERERKKKTKTKNKNKTPPPSVPKTTGIQNVM
jgi:hypothetical protein